jgi:hypothetical protein
VYQAGSHNVETVYVNGSRIVENKNLLRYSVKEIKDELEKESSSFRYEALKMQNE